MVLGDGVRFFVPIFRFFCASLLSDPAAPDSLYEKREEIFGIASLLFCLGLFLQPHTFEIPALGRACAA